MCVPLQRWMSLRCSGCGEAEKKKKEKAFRIMLGSATMSVRPERCGLNSTACDWCLLITFDGRCEVE